MDRSNFDYSSIADRTISNVPEFFSIFGIADHTIIISVTLIVGSIYAFKQIFIFSKDELSEVKNIKDFILSIFFILFVSCFILGGIAIACAFVIGLWTIPIYFPLRTFGSLAIIAVILIPLGWGIGTLIERFEDVYKNFKNGKGNENRSSYSSFKISSNHVIIFLLLIIIAGGGYFLSQDRQSNTEIRYIPKIINQYIPSFNFPPFTGGSSGIKNKAPGDFMIEKGVEMLSPKKPKTNTINPGFTKVCIKDGIGGKKSITVGAVELCPLGYKALK